MLTLFFDSIILFLSIILYNFFFIIKLALSLLFLSSITLNIDYSLLFYYRFPTMLLVTLQYATGIWHTGSPLKTLILALIETRLHPNGNIVPYISAKCSNSAEMYGVTLCDSES